MVSANLTISIRLITLTLIMLAELMVVSLGYDANQPGLLASGEWYGFLSYAGQFAKMLVAILVFSVLGLLPRLPQHFDALKQSIESYPFRYFAVLQVTIFALFLWCTSAIFASEVGFNDISGGLVGAWLVMLVATGGFWFLSLAPLHFWRTLFTTETRVFMAALAVGILAWMLAGYAQVLWTPLSDLTFRLSATLLNQLYPEIFVDIESKQLGVMNFIVGIAPECSGYEGMGLMVVFTAFYLSMFRNEFRFPQALLLFPIGIATIWIFNIFRIVLLISIGASFSPAVAIGGFHSQAGWISFIIVIVAILALAYRTPFFSNFPKISVSTGPRLTLAMALLIPFVVLLASTIFTSALSADFDWFYPVRVIAVGMALGICWSAYRFARRDFNLLPWLAGIVVFGLWLLLVPDDAEQNSMFTTELSAASQPAMIFWLVFRFLGAVITVPIAEEFLFRGYLLSRLARCEVTLEGRITFSWVALIISSILFGLLHSAWLAGIAAGLIYGWVRYRSESIRDAVIAHSSTNLLLSVYVLSTGRWSLW